MPNETTISEKTKVPLKSVLSIIALTILATGGFLSVKQDLAELKSAQKQNWTRLHQVEWAQDLKNMNGDAVKVPKVDFTENTITARK